MKAADMDFQNMNSLPYKQRIVENEDELCTEPEQLISNLQHSQKAPSGPPNLNRRGSQMHLGSNEQPNLLKIKSINPAIAQADHISSMNPQYMSMTGGPSNLRTASHLFKMVSHLHP